ncbi:MAG: thioredoxin domain-containing protein [Edaphobacter sp.]|uniref:DsbA family protein n=1 Tax=Edaphobacter sp. TaxID=1934404 RepID=UPI0023A4ED0F|nr:thioredoxin domain-containing protein [Edaphobacter sp.]MDE1178512.1 thioredoxin domain-containing protein [Edaphobacter sp.]
MTRLLLAASLLVASLPAVAQYSAPPNTGNTFKDVSLIKPPAGVKVAILKFEDLECPACANAYPIVHAAADRYHIPIVRHDFPLRMHIWSRDAAITARYLQDKVSPSTAEEFRGAVFAAQTSIASKDDLSAFTRRFFQQHKLNVPFVMDPAGLFAAEVQADYTLGERIGLSQTPTIWVVSQKEWVQVTDINQLYATIDAVQSQVAASTPGTPAANSKLKHAIGTQK